MGLTPWQWASESVLLQHFSHPVLQPLSTHSTSIYYQPVPGTGITTGSQAADLQGAEPSWSALLLPKASGEVKREHRLDVSAVGFEGRRYEEKLKNGIAKKC